MPDDLATLEAHSVQEHQPKSSTGSSFIWWTIPDVTGDDELLPDFGSWARDRRLRELYRGVFAWVAQAAVSSLVKRFKQTPWQLKGGRNLSSYFQQVLQDAHFGAGWGDFLALVMLDFLTCDYGAYIEVIAAGKPDGPIRGRVLGLAHLDSLRCIPTGNLEFPVIYWSRVTGKMHRLHRERVIRLVDMPDGDDQYFTPGLCAMSRAISILAMQEPMQRYIAGMMRETPPAGILYNWGMTQDTFDAALKEYIKKRASGYKGVFAISDVAKNDVGGNFLKFATAPDGFNYAEYTEIAVNAFSAAFGIDRQDIWPLSGKMAGTATQSAILAEKSKGMAYGDLLQMFERVLNLRVLPPAIEFQFAYRDEEADAQRAERLQTIVSIGNALRQDLSPKQILQFYASQSEELREIVTDENGEIVELPDDDVEDEEATVEETAAPAQPDTTPRSENADSGAQAAKEISQIEQEFKQAFAAVLDEARSQGITRRRAGVLVRGLVNRHGRRAFMDGLIDGGVTDGALDEEDQSRLAVMLAQQSQYVTSFLDSLYAENGGISDAQAANKPAQWYGGSIQPFYDAGRLSADKNGNYECVGPVDENSCDTCSVAAGQIHRLKAWARLDLLFPHGHGILCGRGKLCRHRLVRTDEKARGKLYAIPRAA